MAAAAVFLFLATAAVFLFHCGLVPLPRRPRSLFSLSRRRQTLSSPAPPAFPCYSAPPPGTTTTWTPPSPGTTTRNRYSLIHPSSSFLSRSYPSRIQWLDVFWYRAVPLPPGTTCWTVAILKKERKTRYSIISESNPFKWPYVSQEERNMASSMLASCLDVRIDEPSTKENDKNI